MFIAADGETVLAIKHFAPPTVHDAAVQPTMRGGFHTARAAGLQWPAGVIKPDIATAHQHAADLDIVVFDEHQMAGQFAMLGKMSNFLDEPFAFLISWMRFAGVDELHRAIGVLGQLGDFLELIEY